MMEFFIFIIDEMRRRLDGDVVEADFDYEKNRNVRNVQLYLKK